MTSRHTKAINNARLKVESAEHDLLVMIALHRARNGRTERFPFKFNNRMREAWLTARIQDNSGCRGIDSLVIDYYKDGAPYYETPLPLADKLKDDLSK